MLLYLCASFNQNNKKQTKMKKIILVAVVAGMTALVSCGGGDADAEVKRLADSTEAARIADSANAAAAAAETEAKRVSDSAAAAAEATRVADSVAAAGKGKKKP